MHALLILLFTLGSLFNGRPEVELLFAGDAMQHAAQLKAAARTDGSHDYSECFELLRPYVSKADYAVVNLEVPLGGKPYTGYPCFSAPGEYAVALADAGFDMMLTANNHTLDRNTPGLLKTLDHLDNINVDHIGTYRNQAERDSVIPYIKEVGGIKLGFINYTYGTNGIVARGDGVVDYIDREKIHKDIVSTRKAGAELIVACMHWGDEYKLLPNAAQKSLADYLVDEGVDLIIGSHPHVIQPIEMRKRADGRNVLVVYSLGNFISNMMTRDTRGGIMVKVTLTRDDDGKAIVKRAVYRPVFTIPGDTEHNFRLTVPEDCDDPQWSMHAKAFDEAAEEIFGRYNIGVARDTTSISRQTLTASGSLLEWAEPRLIEVRNRIFYPERVKTSLKDLAD